VKQNGFAASNKRLPQAVRVGYPAFKAAFAMKSLLLAAAVLMMPFVPVSGQLSKNRSSLNLEPGTFSVEGMTPKPIVLKVQLEAPDVSHQQVSGGAGLLCPRHARHLDRHVRHGLSCARPGAPWRRRGLGAPDRRSSPPIPILAANLKKLLERTQKVEELIRNRQVALGMTSAEVQASLGKPTRNHTRRSTPAGQGGKTRVQHL
jgi:hypothetical protein